MTSPKDRFQGILEMTGSDGCMAQASDKTYYWLYYAPKNIEAREVGTRLPVLSPEVHTVSNLISVELPPPLFLAKLNGTKGWLRVSSTLKWSPTHHAPRRCWEQLTPRQLSDKLPPHHIW